jgi:hypothetical protein
LIRDSLIRDSLIRDSLIRDSWFPEYATSPEDYETNMDAYIAIFLFGLIGVSIKSYVRGKRKLKTGHGYKYDEHAGYIHRRDGLYWI